ncbi:MAG: hypothetical protein ABI488_21305 [Polyangiaceae bacterium]
MDYREDEQNEEDASGGGGGFQLEHLQSYLRFGKAAVRKRWLTALAIFGAGMTLTIAIAVYAPRTFACTTVLMGSGSMLDGQNTPNALVGAQELILRHQNLESMIRDIGLIEKNAVRRPPLLRLKDRLSRAVSGPLSKKIQLASLVGTLETKIDVSTEKGDLIIKASWSDALTAAELAAAARDSFVKARHTAEISAFEEKMAILDGHGDKLREEIGVLADQLKSVRDAKIGEVREMRTEANKAKAAELAAERRNVIVRAPAANPAQADTQTPELKGKLEALRAKLATSEADRDQRLRAAQAKLDDLKLKLTPSHPAVVAQQQQVAMLSEVPSDVALMRAEVKDMAGELKQREGLASQGGLGASTGQGGARSVSAVSDLLPLDITDLLQRDNLDPGLTAQLSSTVMKYGALRDDLITTRIELDTAQAAFNHRYQVIIPAEVPTKAEKPKPALIVGGGMFLWLVLALFIPIWGELKKGVIVESWQAEQLQLPVLAELRLPPNSTD